MKLKDIAGEIEIQYLLENELIAPEHVDADAD